MSEQSELLMNELVAACIAFGREREPDWQSRIGKAQHELKVHIAELEQQAWNLNLANERLEVFIDRLIEAGNALDVPPDDFSEEQKEWREIVNDWRGIEQ